MISAAAQQRVSDPVITGLVRQHLQARRDFLTATLTQAQVSDPGGSLRGCWS